MWGGGAWVRKHLLLERITGSSFWKALSGQEVEGTRKEAETIKSFTYLIFIPENRVGDFRKVGNSRRLGQIKGY